MESKKAGLDAYDIETGKKIDTLEVKGLSKILGNTVNIYGYDLIKLN
ncbi:hypothetical protein GCM10011409_22080 [Lentibacillus populi]|uniref:Uncharacterized protein n=1 Tax=Lentibacillus populi TaxID=1827502 RepID=A0A9W5TYA4_9BACI|nr:hypothetical protein GCM10011409_22080 [Lentibacillus populi]